MIWEEDSPLSFIYQIFAFLKLQNRIKRVAIIYNYSIKWIGKLMSKNDIGSYKLWFHILNKGKLFHWIFPRLHTKVLLL